ncbi:hypothetical protein J3R82DRAFT_7272 [Butyriboletus roseoflavus]|nr:hypothetical protein J3R82DRAFT_7272 [Butyriboletus roseoflavus]
MTSGKRPAEPAQAAFLTHSSTLNGRHSATPDGTLTPRTRKPKSKKKREARYEEEIQYNLSYDFRGAGSRRQVQSSRMRDETDFTPPPTYETATAVSTLVSENFVHQGGPPHPGLVSPALTVASLPMSTSHSHQAGSDRSDTFSIDTASLSLLQPPHEEDGSSIELVDLEPSERWELDRVRGIPLDERVKRHKMRTETTVPPGSTLPHRTRLASQPTVCRHPGSQARFLASQLSLRIPESRDRYEDDRNQDNNSDLSTPPTPKHHRMPSIPSSPSRFFHGRSQSPQPSSSVISLLRNPSPFFKSTPSLLNLSPSHHGTPHRARTKLFHRKSKERASSEPLEDWEVLERTGSGGSIDGSLPPPSPPATPQNTAVRQLPRSTAPDVFSAPPTKVPADRSRKVNTVQIPQTVGSDVHRPASPPFVARHVRRHTTSSRGSQMSASSAPVSPISVSSTSTFSTSPNTIAGEDVPAAIQILSNREVTSEPPRAVGSRGYEPSLSSRTPRVSSPAPAVPVYEHDPDLPIPNPAMASLPTRSATERIVRPPDARDENHALVRGRSLSRDMGLRSAPAYSSIFPSGPPTPLPNMTQSLPPPISQPSPRRHYPGRPLPATPPVSPSLTWILDKGVKHVSLHPKAMMVSAAPTTPPIPEGLLIDLDDDSLDAAPQPAPNPITPLCMDFLGLDDDNGDDNDNASDSGTVSPPGPLTPTTSGYTSASSLTLSTAASSVEYFDTSMQTTPTSDVPDINGLVSSLGEQGMSDGSNYDALLLIADLLGPATPSPESDGDDDGAMDPSYLVGKVELVRKRLTRDGRVKLKMSLFGVAVEKCAICMTQFKADDGGILGATCQHAFHEKCLENWLDRSQTCPLCRERLEAR